MGRIPDSDLRPRSAAAEDEIATAKEDLERARKAIPIAEERLARIKEFLKDESPLSVQLMDSYTAAAFIPKLEEQKAKFSLEQAESQKRVLLEDTKGVRTRELRSAIEKADSDELVKQLTWDIEKSRLGKAKRMLRNPDLSEVQKRILALIQQAYPVEGAIEVKLAQLVSDGKADEALQVSLRDLTNQLDSLVARAEGERSVRNSMA